MIPANHEKITNEKLTLYSRLVEPAILTESSDIGFVF